MLSDLEKSAEVMSLVQAGLGFDTSVELVKNADSDVLTKVASLVDIGFDLDSALNLVKTSAEKIKFKKILNKDRDN
jgi:type II secretory pathway component PulF